MMGLRMSRDLLHDRVHDCRGTDCMMGSRMSRDLLHDGFANVAGLTA